MKSALYLLDGYGLIYRSYFAFIRNPLKNPQGRNSSAVFGFFRALLSLLGERKPEYFAVVLDSRGPTFRHEMYPDYKATRQKTPEDLHQQIPVIEEIAEAFGFPMIRVDGVEADDIMATLARLCKEEGRPCYIVSGDKDMLQAVDGPVKVLKPDKGGFQEMGRREVFETWNVNPEQITDYLALVGDSADNVPGAKGIGEKTAAALLSEYGDLENLYRSLETVKSESWRTKLRDSRENVELSKRLVVLKTDVPLSRTIESFLLPPLRNEAAAPLFLREGIKSIADEISSGPDRAAKKSGEAPAAGELFSGKEDIAPAAGGEPKNPASHGTAQAGVYETVSTLEALDGWIERARNAKICAFDTETTGIDPFRAELVGFSIAVESGRACYVPVKAPFGDGLGLTAVLPRLSALLEDPEIRIIGQNIKFDYKILRRVGIDIKNMYFDTMIAAWLLASDSGTYNMDRLAEQYLGYRTLHYGDVVGKDQTFDSVPLDLATRYAAEDADITFRLYETFFPLLKERGLDDLFFRIELPLVRILAEMELEGIRLDPGILEKFGAELEKDLSSIQAEIYRLCGREFNINSTKQLQEVLFKERKLRPSKKIKTGYSTDNSVLEELSRDDPVPEKILRHRMLAKLKSTYVDALPKLISTKTGRVHTSFHQTGTATGRLSSKDPNLQNIPVKDEEGRRIRSAFIPKQGCVFLSADYAQIELVVLAHLSGDPGLAAAFEAGADVHRRTGALIFGVPENEVTGEQRRIAKTINFGVMYGMSAFRLARELGIPRKNADLFIEQYFLRYSKIKQFIEETVKDAERTGKVTTILGRERPIYAITSKNKNEKMGAERIAVNTPIQGSAADIVKLAMIRLSKRLAAENLDSRLILQVHDELIFEVPHNEVERMTSLVEEEMEKAVELRIPLRVNVETGSSWGGMH
jgi:DNA polymerase-1